MSLNRKRWFDIAWKANESFYIYISHNYEGTSWELNTRDLLTTGQDSMNIIWYITVINRITE